MAAIDPLARRVLVAVGTSKYKHLPVLPKAATDVRAVAERFRADGFSASITVDKPHSTVTRALGRALPSAGLARAGTVLVILWAGHAGKSSATKSLRLFTSANREEDGDMEVVTAAGLAEKAVGSGASQVLVLIDACRSGGGLIDVAQVADAVNARLTDPQQRWFGVVASCQDFEDAVDGAFAEQLLALLQHGPQDQVLRLRWSSYQAGLRGDDLVDALLKEWNEERQFPKQWATGNAGFVLPNPLYRPDAADQVVEHLLWAARGGTQDEVGNWFTGRERRWARWCRGLGRVSRGCA